MKRIVYFIMAGGEGMRLWPMSRTYFPKQLHPVLGKNSLLQQSISRVVKEASPKNILIGTRQDLYFSIKEQWENMRLGTEPWLILEPLSRNTAPAIALAVLACRERYQQDVIMVTLAADHVIKQENRFRQLLRLGIKMSQKGNIVTFGIIATYPETGYGYVKIGKQIEKDVFCVDQFKEKPTLDIAKKYLRGKRYLWNSGIFIFDTEVLAENLKKFSPALWETAQKLWQKRKEKNGRINLAENLFKKLPNISIDYAVMEKSSKLAVIKADFKWCDVGCWRMVHELSPKDKNGNVFSGDVCSLDTKNSFIKSEKRFVATVGVRDLVVIDTPDALLISDKDRTQEVKKIVENLNIRKSTLTKFHTTVNRPWGNFTVLEEGPGYKIKRVVVNPRQKLSLQKHNYRSEHWVIISGKAQIISGQNSIYLKPNESFFIPKGRRHQIVNAQNQELVIIEVQTGKLITEDDIVRFKDIYERETLNSKL